MMFRMRFRPISMLLCAIAAVRALQVIRIWLGYQPPIASLTLLQLTSSELGGFLLGPLFVRALVLHIKRIYHPYFLTRAGDSSYAAREYAKSLMFDSLALVLFVQLSGLCVALLTNVEFGSRQLFLYLVPAPAMLLLHYILAGSILLLLRLVLGGVVLPCAAAMIVLCWDSFAQYVIVLIRCDAYIGWRLAGSVLGPHAYQFFVPALRLVALAMVVPSISWLVCANSSGEKITRGLIQTSWR